MEFTVSQASETQWNSSCNKPAKHSGIHRVTRQKNTVEIIVSQARKTQWNSQCHRPAKHSGIPHVTSQRNTVEFIVSQASQTQWNSSCHKPAKHSGIDRVTSQRNTMGFIISQVSVSVNVHNTVMSVCVERRQLKSSSVNREERSKAEGFLAVDKSRYKSSILTTPLK